MKYCFDIDGTLCHTPSNPDGHGMRYGDATPFPWMVKLVNRLYDEGHYIIMMTARGRGSGINHSDLTRNQLAMWGYKYHELEPMFHKPTADIFIDDKGINVNEWLKQQQLPQIKGIIAGAFDVMHPGYIRMFADAKQHCNHLTVALHEDPSMARPHKLKPVQTVEERKEILKAIKYVDDVVVYQAEDTFLSYLNDYDIRFLGTDYKDGTYSGKELDIDIVWLDRENHNYSSTKLKTDIFKSILPRATGNYD
jgi:glycerol-3-phosphate cytidylyltransferase|tara:strand:- start:466 stop:1218 length:753 start_codon:yes stop_codon:yes gene_type:complete